MASSQEIEPRLKQLFCSSWQQVKIKNKEVKSEFKIDDKLVSSLKEFLEDLSREKPSEILNEESLVFYLSEQCQSTNEKAKKAKKHLESYSEQTIVRKFCTFINWQEYNIIWKQDRKSVHNFRRIFQEKSSFKPSFYLIYFAQQWRETRDEFAKRHLWAYAQKPCYKAAHKFYHNYRLIFPDKTIKDYFDIALEKVVSTLAQNQDDYDKLSKSFTVTAFKNYITDEMRILCRIRGIDSHNIGCNDYGLLKNISETKFNRILNKYEVSQNLIDSYLMAWDCFKEFCPQKVSLKIIDDETWKKIWQEYCKEKKKSLNIIECRSSFEIKQWMDDCILYLRKDIKPLEFISLDIEKGRENDREMLDTLLLNDNCQEQLSPMDIAIVNQDEEENKRLQHLINSILKEHLEQLNQKVDSDVSMTEIQRAKLKQDLEFINLFYCQQLNQTIISQKYNINQGTVSRRLSKIESLLLDDLICRLKEKQDWNITCNSEVIEEIKVYLAQWLSSNYCFYINQN